MATQAKEASASVESLETRINNEENSAEQGNASNEPSALDNPETEAASMLDAIGKVASSRINEVSKLRHLSVLPRTSLEQTGWLLLT